MVKKFQDRRGTKAMKKKRWRTKPPWSLGGVSTVIAKQQICLKKTDVVKCTNFMLSRVKDPTKAVPFQDNIEFWLGVTRGHTCLNQLSPRTDVLDTQSHMVENYCRLQLCGAEKAQEITRLLYVMGYTVGTTCHHSSQDSSIAHYLRYYPSTFSSVPNSSDRLIFIGPRCPWGPIYGSGCLSLSEYKTFCRLNWCDSGWWIYKHNTNW